MWAKQSTAATLIIGPVLDSAGAEYASAVIGDLSISKNGGTLTAMAAAATLTYIANGQYTLVTTTANLDTLGRAQITCNKSTYQMPPVNLMVLPATVFDALVTNAVNATGGLTGATGTITGLAGVIATTTNITAGTITTTTNLTNLPTIPANWITAAGITDSAFTAAKFDTACLTAAKFDTGCITASALATDAVNEIVDQVWDESNAAHGTPGSTGEALGSAFYNTENRLPAALVSGRIDANVGAMASGVLTATAIAADAITAAKVAADVHQETIELAFTYNATADYATATAGSLVKEIADNAGGSSLTAGDIADAVWDEALAGHLASGSTGEALNSAGGAGDPWITTLPGAYTGSQAGKILADILVDTGTTLQGELDGIQADTEDIQARLPAALVSGRIDASIGAMAANTLTASALATDAVTEIQSGLSTLDAAGVRTAVGLATANLDTQIGTLATAVNLATVAGYLDTEIAAILQDTNELQADWANGGRLDVILDTAAADALKAADRSGYVLALAGGAISNPQTATETFVVTTGGNTFTVTGSGITSTGGRSAPTLAKT